MIKAVGRSLLVFGSAVAGAVVCAGFFWIGSDHEVLETALISWAVAGAVVGGLTARALLLD